MKVILAPFDEMVTSLFGALRFAQGDSQAAAYFNVTHEGFWRSFTAAIIIAVPFTLLLFVRYLVSDSDIALYRYVSIHAIAYVVGWVAFPLLALFLVTVYERQHRFIAYIVTYNWASVLQNLLYMPFAILVEAHFVTGSASTLIGLVLLAIVFFYIWFITKCVLDISNFQAITIIVLDLVLSIFITSTTTGMLNVS